MIRRILQNLRERRNNILSGNVNCIPSPFVRFRNDFPGIEQGRYYLISASTKVGKTQLMNYLFLYNSVLYSYNHPDKVHLRMLYYNLEETQEAITLRFMCHLLYILSNKKIRKTPNDLKSVREDKIIDEHVLDLFETEPYKSILEHFEKVVTFLDDRNPYGIYKQAKKYAENNGVTYTRKLQVKNNNGDIIDERDVFDYYVPNDPKEYVMIVTDTVNIISPDGNQSLYEAIASYSQYMIQLRNRYCYIPICIQQQNAETTNLEAFKSNKIRPTVAGLADCKATAKDCNVFIGLSNPYAFEMNSYAGYDLTRLKGNARFLEVVINRDGESNGMIGLYFDGAVNYYEELPPPRTNEYNTLVERVVNRRNSLFLLISKVKHLIYKQND